MLSIKALAPGNEDYYLTLAREDYYFQGGEPPGVWLGQGAAILGLEGPVTREQLSALFRGVSPGDPTKKLVQNAGKDDRQSGWDLTFSVPKTVSILWSAAEAPVRAEIEAAKREAIQATLAFLEAELAHSRVGKGGDQRVTARLVVAAFPHSTSRAMEPQLHDHCLLLNVAVGPDGKTRTIISKPFYDHKMLLGALFRVELAHQIRTRLALALEPKRTWFEIAGIPDQLIREQSTRRGEIEEELERVGLAGPRAAAIANLATRKSKDMVPPRDELLRRWRELAGSHGLHQQGMEFLLGRARPLDTARALQKASEQALAAITQEQSHFSRTDLLRGLAEAACSLGVSLHEVTQHLDALLASGDIVQLGTRNGQERFSTNEILRLEQDLLDTIDSLAAASFKGLRDSTLTSVITRQRDFQELPSKPGQNRVPIVRAASAAKNTLKRILQKDRFDTLRAEQANAVAYLTQSPGKVKVLTGLAGTSKTTTINAVREAFERDGYRVLGAALSGKAAQELATRAGIDSNTIRMRELQLHPSLRHRARQTLHQLYRAARYKTNGKLEKLRIDQKTVLVVDEASMVGTKDMLMLARAVKKGGGILILVGDKDQLPSIEAGGALGSITGRVGAVNLTEILRQSDPGDRQAVAWMPQSKAEEVLAHYLEKQQLHVAPDRGALVERVIADWTAGGGVTAPEHNLICTALNSEVDLLNDLAQAARMDQGRLDPARRLTVTHGATANAPQRVETFYAGDRIAFTARSQKHKIENGFTGTIFAISAPPLGPKQLSVLVDGEKTPRVLPVKATLAPSGVSFRRGYAFTTHKLQGGTAKNVFVAMTGPMLNRELAYVQFSRHRERLALYTTESLAGKELARRVQNPLAALRPIKPADLRSPLSKRIASSQVKDLADDVRSSSQPGPQLRYLTRAQAEEKLQAYAEGGNLKLSKTPEALAAAVIAAWSGRGGPDEPSKHVMYALSASELTVLNDRAQQLRLEAGLTEAGPAVRLRDVTLHVGDEVRLTSSVKKQALQQDQRATVTGIGLRHIELDVEGMDHAVRLPKRAAPLALAYALPTRQMTREKPEHALVLLSDISTDQQISYVYHSLHTRRCTLFTTEQIAGAALMRRVAPDVCEPPPIPFHSEQPADLRPQIRRRLTP